MCLVSSLECAPSSAFTLSRIILTRHQWCWMVQGVFAGDSKGRHNGCSGGTQQQMTEGNGTTNGDAMVALHDGDNVVPASDGVSQLVAAIAAAAVAKAVAAAAEDCNNNEMPAAGGDAQAEKVINPQMSAAAGGTSKVGATVVATAAARVADQGDGKQLGQRTRHAVAGSTAASAATSAAASAAPALSLSAQGDKGGNNGKAAVTMVEEEPDKDAALSETGVQRVSGWRRHPSMRLGTVYNMSAS